MKSATIRIQAELIDRLSKVASHRGVNLTHLINSILTDSPELRGTYNDKELPRLSR